MKFGSWSYDGKQVQNDTNKNNVLLPYTVHVTSFQLDIRPANRKAVSIGLSNFISEDHWEILGVEGARVVDKYDCCVEPYPSLEYVLRMRDKTMGSISIG